MTKVVKQSKYREENEKKSKEFSMKIGIMSALTVITALILDMIDLLFNDIRLISTISGIVLLVVFGILLDLNILRKIRNKFYLREIIDSATLSSIFTYALEKSILPYIGNSIENKLQGLIMIACFLSIPMGVTIILLRKKEWKYNVD